jgi:hypothetical protein
LQVRKILAYPPPLAKDLFGCCADGGHSGVEAKVPVDAICEIQKALAQQPSTSERLECILCKLRSQRNARRLKSELVGCKSLWTTILGQRPSRFFPGEIRTRRWSLNTLHRNFASRFHDQFCMRFADSEEVKNVSKIVHSLGDCDRGWLDVQLALCQPVLKKRTRLETSDMVPNRDRIFVLVRGSMDNFVDHRPIVTGSVRAWLK